ncbi:MAG: RNA methyltransferase [Nitrospirae bacterium]|nr:MAG: RNA methyltransferase [Nitrospirota bacterium]
MASPMSSSPRRITSRRNAHFQRWRSLWESKGIKMHQQCLVSGEKLVNETLMAHPALCDELIETESYQRPATQPSDLARFCITNDLFRELDRFGTHYPLLVCRLPSLPKADLTQAPSGLEMLCPAGDPANLGAIIRSCSAFGVHRVVLLREAAHPFHPKTIRTSSGAVFRQSMEWGPGIAELAASRLLKWVTALDLRGTSLSTYIWPQAVRLLVGEEGTGLPDLPFVTRIVIPHTLAVQSLNAAVAASIALFAYRQSYPLP